MKATITQIAIIGALVLFIAFIWSNTYQNLQKLGVSSGFDFLCASASLRDDMVLVLGFLYAKRNLC